MKTLRLTVDPANLHRPESQNSLNLAADILRSGGLVALPTETVYGLGANALNPAAVASIFAAKARPAWDPVIVHIASEEMLEPLVTGIPESAHKLMAAYWPGPLTMLLPRSASVPDSITAGRPLVGIRMPSHPVALELIRLAGIPIAAPSANTFGHTSPTTATHVLDDLDGRIDAVLDAGPTQHGLESTVLDPNTSPMRIYRPGAITAAEIHVVAGPVELYRTDASLTSTPREALPSPGVGLRHYAPRAHLILIEAALPDLPLRFAEAVRKYSSQRVGIMLPIDVATYGLEDAACIYPWGRWQAPESMAQTLYAALRALDSENCSVILCPVPPAEGIGAAIRDRLRKAAQPPSR